MSQPSKPQAAPTAPGREPAPQSQGVVRLRKGEMLFEEGDNAGSMYLIRQGSIRVFKKKGDGDIEIETIRANQLIGYGLVVGLDRTGDQVIGGQFTIQAMMSMLNKMGVNLVIDPIQLLTRNIASVMVTAVTGRLTVPMSVVRCSETVTPGDMERTRLIELLSLGSL